jgi:hypothetical protein
LGHEPLPDLFFLSWPKAWASVKSAVYFVYVWPEARSSAAGVRSHELLNWLRSDGWSITALSPSKLSAYSAELEAMGIAAATCPANEIGHDDFLRALKPEVVIFDRFVMEEQFGWKARELWPNATQIIDTQDLHSVRRAREVLVKASATWNDILELPLNKDLPDDMIRELSSLHRVEGALVVSAWEESFLRERFNFPAKALLHLPLTGRPEKFCPLAGTRKGFAFLGNFRHGPNLDGIKWFISEIWPAWREVNAQGELHLYGAYPPEQISHWKGKQGVFAHGPVEDHRAALMKHEALVAPLRFGAGIKGKILEAWSTGTPVIGTPIAFEGMCNSEDKAGLVFTTAETFVVAASALKNQWNDLQKNSILLLEKSYSAQRLKKAFLEFIGPRTNPRPNLIGAMLRHSQSNATKYFSRWIEEKNKKPELK